MRITYLMLENFIPIEVGMQKRKMELDLRNNTSTINLIVGRMGSAKTFILSHLQPFPSLGSFDMRNQDSHIITGSDGLKVLEIINDANMYVITHKYTWNKTTEKHTIKSYITKNGEEMNPNGNQSSFKDYIKDEFNLDQSYLRLMRLGPNVENLINMSSSERKTFISTLLPDMEFYQIINKKITQDLRINKAQVDLLVKNISSVNMDELSDQIKDLKSSIDIDESQLNEYHNSIEHHKGRIAGVCESLDTPGKSFDEIKLIHDRYEQDYSTKYSIEQKQMALLSEKFGYLDDYTMENINKTQGSISSTIQAESEQYRELINQINKMESEYNAIYDKRQILMNEHHTQTLNDTYTQLVADIKIIEDKLKGFECSYNTLSIRNIISSINTFVHSMVELSSIDRESLKKIFFDKNLKSWVTHECDRLSREKAKYERSLSSLEYTAKYTTEITLFFPIGCPSRHSCPFVKSHPESIQQDLTNQDVINYRTEYKDKIDKIDSLLNKYSEYGLFQMKLNSLKEMWNTLKTDIEKLGCLREANLYNILTNITISRNWYDYDKLMNILELCENRESYYMMLERSDSLKSEITSLSVYNLDGLSEQLATIEKDISALKEKAENLSTNIDKNMVEREKYDKLYVDMVARNKLVDEISSTGKEMENLSVKMSTILSALYSIDYDNKQIRLLEPKYFSLKTKLSIDKDRLEGLKHKLYDVNSSKDEYERLMIDQKYLTSLKKASSSDKGIPIIFVKLFLSTATFKINQLISNIFGDDIEILDFKIDETSFTIPYKKNGRIIDDISKASQGERSIISLAISFVLREDVSAFNILLLDEMDGPLYKDDRLKFIYLLNRQIEMINCEQVFVISHNNTFDTYDVTVICTTDEVIENFDKDKVIYL